MIQLKLDWQQQCACCGTEIILDFLNDCPKELVCPWCGATILIDHERACMEAKRLLSDMIADLDKADLHKLTGIQR